MDYLRTAFPTRQMRAFRATDGSMRSEPMLDDEGNGVLCQEAVDARDELIERLCSIPPVPAVSSRADRRSEEHTSELQSLMRISYAVFCLKKKKRKKKTKV